MKMSYIETNKNKYLVSYGLSTPVAKAGEFSRIQGKPWLEIETSVQTKSNTKASSIPLVL